MESNSRPLAPVPARKVTAPKPADNPPAQAIGIRAEIVKDVPVVRQAPADNHTQHAPEAAQTAYNPISSANHAAPTGAISEDAELDNILEDVNHEVGAVRDPAKKSKVLAVFSRSTPKLRSAKKPNSKPQKTNSKIAIIIAAAIAALLIAAAVYAFRQSQDSAKLSAAHQAAQQNAKTQAASSSASATTFSAKYLDDFNNSLTKDSTQDFDPGSLSDSSLGL